MTPSDQAAALVQDHCAQQQLRNPLESLTDPDTDTAWTITTAIDQPTVVDFLAEAMPKPKPRTVWTIEEILAREG